MIYTPETSYDSTPVTIRGDGAGIVVRQEDWSDNADFEAGEYITIKSILKKLEKATETKKLSTSTLFEDDNIELNFTDGYGMCPRSEPFGRLGHKMSARSKPRRVLYWKQPKSGYNATSNRKHLSTRSNSCYVHVFCKLEHH